MTSSRTLLSALLILAAPALAENTSKWKVLPPRGERTQLPDRFGDAESTVSPGDDWPQDNQFRWMHWETEIPAAIESNGKKQSVAGKPVGLQFNCGDGGEVYVNGELHSRYDNDHPALVLVAEKARPGTPVHFAAQVYGRVQGGDKFDEATWTLIDPQRALEPVRITVDGGKATGQVPDGLIGLSQGGGLADYEDDTAAKLVEGGFRWFRMDNILTNVLKKNDAGDFVYDWSDFDRRLDFIVKKMRADPILAVSYMPIVLDAVDNHDRQSAPNDYGVWEDMCYRAASRAVERGVRVPYWEVWNEVNTGWLKPGPQDTGKEVFRKIYQQAVGREDVDLETVRRFEAYCKLYEATVRGVKRADGDAKIGGPALASGPFEQSEYGYCANGRGFARGLMIWCMHRGLPLDFVSWHEYFHPADVIAKQADTFRAYLEDFPRLKKTVGSYMLTEWNEAWWINRPQDHELGAAYCADCVVRAFVPHGIDRPCFFYVKQGDMNFRGDWSLLMAGNTPKASYNMAKIFNSLSGRYLELDGADDDVCGLAAWDASKGRLAIALVNFRYRHALERDVQLKVTSLPRELRDGTYREYTIDATHSNVWHDVKRAELEQTGSGSIPNKDFDLHMKANSIVLIELSGK